MILTIDPNFVGHQVDILRQFMEILPGPPRNIQPLYRPQKIKVGYIKAIGRLYVSWGNLFRPMGAPGNGRFLCAYVGPPLELGMVEEAETASQTHRSV